MRAPRHDHPARWSDGLLHAVLSWLVFAALVALIAPSHAADKLPDPTRPPGMAAAMSPDASGARRPAAARAPAESASAPTLQSLHLPRQGQPSALVDGRIVRPGDRLETPQGPRVVVAIDAQGLLLRPVGESPKAARATQRLDLLAGIVRHPTDTPASAPRLAAHRSTPP
jgi:hypothetical protein